MIMKMRILILSWLSSLLLMERVSAQDFQYSQPFAIPMYMNPAFTGNGIVDCKDIRNWDRIENIKASFQSRTQWNNGYSGQLGALEYSWGRLGKMLTKNGKNKGYDKTYIWSFGLQLHNDQNRKIELNQNYLAFSTSVDIPISLNLPGSTLKFGYQFGLLNRSLNKENFDFADEFNGAGFNPNTTSELPNVGGSKLAIDIGSVGALFGAKHFFIGAAVHHITEPNQSLWEGNDLLRKRYSIHGSYIYTDKSSKFGKNRLFLVSTFKKQGSKTQWDGAIFWENKPSGSRKGLFQFGALYRGIPIQKSPDNFVQNDAMVISLGYRFNQFNLTVSKDFPVSRSKVFGSALEISLSFQKVAESCIGKGGAPPNRMVTCPGGNAFPWKN